MMSHASLTDFFLLGIETSTLQGSVAIAKVQDSNVNILFSKKWLRQRSHGELVTSSIEEALLLTEIKMEKLSGICLTVGPGSFTGIRVGMSVVKALSYGLEKPIYVINSLDALALQTPISKKPLLALLNAHKNQCYVSIYESNKDRWRCTLKPRAMTLEEIEVKIKKNHICVGDGYTVFESGMSRRLKSRLERQYALKDHPEAETLVLHALQKRSPLKQTDWKSLEALYIRGSEAEEKLKSGLLKPLPEL